MTISEIKCADDLAGLAREALNRVWVSKNFCDLMGAVLMANHVADWYFIGAYAQKFDDPQRLAMIDAYPEWDIIRKLANGTKHCNLIATKVARPDQLMWEHDDWWGSPGHVGGDNVDWFIEVNGKPRSVAVLVKDFLDKFEDVSLRP
jgi:hypothetical protein